MGQGRGERTGYPSWLLALPAYLAAGVLLGVGGYFVARGLQPGVTMNDPRPTNRLLTGFGYFACCFMLFPLGYFAVKRGALLSSLVTTAAFAAATIFVLCLAACKVDTYVAIYLVLATLFVYPLAIAGVRIAGLRRQRSRRAEP